MIAQDQYLRPLDGAQVGVTLSFPDGTNSIFPRLNETAEKVLGLLPRDKKAVGGRINWVLPERIGKVRITPEVPNTASRRGFPGSARSVE